MDVAILITIFVVGFAMGMYVTTQIGDWINKQINKK
tara:strand:+ start:3423 stop:3530 length:108 start_codon:yes stop_codon:yes gene_type:complete